MRCVLTHPHPFSYTAGTLLTICGFATLIGCGGIGSKLVSSGPSTPVSAVSSGPQLGYAWNAEDQTLRPILGVPGSSQVGESVVPAGLYLNAASSSAAALALLVGSDGQIYRMSLPNGTPAQVGLSMSGASIRFSPSGTAALLFVPGSTSASLLTGLSTTPQVRPVSVGAAIVDAATSDAGTVVAELRSGGGAAVGLVTGSGNVQQLGSVAGVGGLSFVGSSEDVLLGDSGANSLTVIRSVSSAPLAVPVATADLLKDPVAVGAAINGKWAVVANGGESSVVRVDLTGASAPQRVASPTQPAVVAQLAGNGVFRFTELSDAPVWISDVTAPTPSMLFIPALPHAASSGQSAGR